MKDNSITLRDDRLNVNMQLKVFKYESDEEQMFNEVRTIDQEDGKILFCASDVAKALGYKNPSKAVIDHCKSGNITKCYVAQRLPDKVL